MSGRRLRLGRPASLRAQLLLGILLPVALLVGVNSVSLYLQALEAADTAYDRTLLASAKAIGELLEVEGPADAPRLRSTVLYSALEAFEADNRSRIYYRVTGFDGEMVSGFEDLPPWRERELPVQGPYAALVDFYDDRFRGEAVRVAVLLQPVAGLQGVGMATIQVAETLELRQALARQLLVDTLWRQGALLAVIALVVFVAVQRAMRPVRRISDELDARAEDDLHALQAHGAPRELAPLLDATNRVMQRLARLLEQRKRFVRDASHQLRTPLAVLKVQVQSALRGDVPPPQALQEIGETVDRATQLANQMLALAKVEQLRQQGPAPASAWDRIVRDVALDVAPLIAERALEFDIETQPAQVHAHEWALRELTRNLLHNAIRHSPPHGRLSVRLAVEGTRAVLTVADDGPGLSPAAREQLFQPFMRDGDAAWGSAGSGTGLGLAICREIVDSAGGTIVLTNREQRGRVAGLDAVVGLPLGEPAARA
jgi:two-component system sensor histidine kinase TctE